MLRNSPKWYQCGSVSMELDVGSPRHGCTSSQQCWLLTSLAIQINSNILMDFFSCLYHDCRVQHVYKLCGFMAWFGYHQPSASMAALARGALTSLYSVNTLVRKSFFIWCMFHDKVLKATVNPTRGRLSASRCYL
jgi:hypothetical protein